MKKGFKIAAGILGAGVAAGLIYRFYKKELKQIKNEETAARKAVENSGISFDKLKEQVPEVDDPNAFIKCVATGMFFNSNVLEDYLDLDLAFPKNGDPGIIHIIESKCKDEKRLDFVFELPNYVRGAFGRPQIADYIRTIKETSNLANDEIVKGPRPFFNVELYVGVRYIFDEEKQSLDNSKDPESSFYRLPKSVYEEFADDRYDGLDNYYRDSIINGRFETPEFKKLLVEQGIVDIQERHFEVADLRVMIRVSYKVAGENCTGINFLKASRVATYFADHLEVGHGDGRRSSTNKVRFEHIMIHPIDEGLTEENEIPCTVYEKVNGTLVESTYLV